MYVDLVRRLEAHKLHLAVKQSAPCADTTHLEAVLQAGAVQILHGKGFSVARKALKEKHSAIKAVDGHSRRGLQHFNIEVVMELIAEIAVSL